MTDEPLPGMPPSPDLMTLSQAMQEFEISYSALYGAIRNGRITRWTHPGTRVLVERSQVERYKIVYDKFKDANIEAGTLKSERKESA